MGGVIRVPDEGHVDMATVVNGTGPGHRGPVREGHVRSRCLHW